MLLDDLGNLTDLKGDTLLRLISERCDTEHLEDTESKAPDGSRSDRTSEDILWVQQRAGNRRMDGREV